MLFERLRRLKELKDSAFVFGPRMTGKTFLMRAVPAALTIECKSGHSLPPAATFKAFKEKFPEVPVLVASPSERAPRKLDSGLEILPWESALRRFRRL